MDHCSNFRAITPIAVLSAWMSAIEWGSMRFDTAQNMRLEQRMKLSPRMIQAMEILQLPLMALQERIEAEMVSNPVLEMREDSGDTEVNSSEDVAEVPAEQALVVQDNENQAEDFARLDSFNNEYEPDVWNGDDYRPARVSQGDRDPKMDAMANAPAPGQSLYDYLMEQWAFVEADPLVLAAGRVIIELIDDDGYLREPLENLLSRTNEPITQDHLRQALALVQSLEPTGVGARNLKECLLLQLAALEREGAEVSLERELVRSFLREIEMNHLPLIARKTSNSLERVKGAIEHLSHLNPRPGRLIGEHGAPAIIPDILVDLDEQGEPIITMTDGHVPSLHISKSYRRMARDGKIDRGAKTFLQRNIRSAQWLIGAIQQRRDTVYRVAVEVFRVQKEFFEHGQAALKPLPMSEVAEKVGVHVATVSRAVAGKYVQTPRGIFPLRIFFSGGVTTAGGEDMAWDAVKAKLREVVDAEDKSKPLSDDELATALQKEGIQIARRTIAKYRKLLNIPPARQRRQY